MLTPLKDFIILEVPVVEKLKSSGGIVLPETMQERPNYLVVIGVGPDVKDIKVGDKAIFDKYAGFPMKIGSKEYLITKSEHIMALYDE